MARIDGDNNCCGLRELAGLSEHSDPTKNMEDIVVEMYGSNILTARNKETNPYKKPKGVRWRTSASDFWSDNRYWLKEDGTKVYESQMRDWDYQHGRGDRYDDDRDSLWRYAVFTQAGTGATYGRKFAALIKKENLGEVVQATTKTVTNPNSGNVLKAWLWTVNHKNLRAWAQKQGEAKAKTKGAK